MRLDDESEAGKPTTATVIMFSLWTECTFSLECTNVCPRGALDVTFGLDVGHRELLKTRVGD